MAERQEAPTSEGPPNYLWWLVPLLLGCISVLTIQVPPMLDWPLHMSQGVILAHLQDPSFVPPNTYCVSPFAPYHLFHYMVRILAVVLPVGWLSQSTLLILLLMYTASVALLLRSYNADIRLLMFAPATFFGYCYIMGFAPHLLGIPFAFASLACAQMWWRTRSTRWAAAMIAALLLCYLCHPVPFFLALGCVGLRLLVDGRSSLRFLLQAGAWLLLPIAAAAQFLFYLQRLGVDQKVWFTAIYPNWNQNNTFGDSVFLRLKLIPAYVLGTEHLETSLVLVSCVLLLSLLGLFWLSQQDTDNPQTDSEAPAKESEAPGSSSSVTLGTVVVVAVLWLGYLFLPDAFMKGNNVYARLIQMALVLTLVCVPALPLGLRMAQRLYLLMALCVCTFLGVNWMYQYEWDRHFDGFHEVIQKLPKGSRYMGLLSQFKNAATWAQVYRGGEARYSFAHFFHMPVRDCNPKAQHPTFGLRSQPAGFSPHKHASYAPYLLVYLERTVQRNRRTFPWLFRKTPYKLVAQKGRWTLWKHKSVNHTKPSKR